MTTIQYIDIIPSTNEQEGKQNMSQLITTTLTATKPLTITQYFFGGFYNGEMFDAEITEHKWENPTVEMVSHSGYNTNKPNTKTARKLIINGTEFIEILPTIFRTNPTGNTRREMNDLTYLYKEEDFQ